MKNRASHRTFLRCALAATASVPALTMRWAKAVDYSELPEEAKGLSGYLAEQQVWVRWQNLPLTTYRAQITQKYPFFYPLCGPVTGISLTNDSGMPYPHHRSLFLGCHPVNGGDYWGSGELDKGQIVSRKLALGKVTEATVEFSDACDWIRAGEPSPFHDQRQFKVTIASPQVHLLDCDFQLTAMTDVEIEQAKHSFFAIKTAYDLAPIGGGTLENSEGGKGAEGTFGKAAKWCSFYGKRHGNPGVVEGIAILNHPQNFDGKCVWFTRNYGHLSPSPFSFRKEPWKYAKGEVIRLRYRVVLHAGSPREAGLAIPDANCPAQGAPTYLPACDRTTDLLEDPCRWASSRSGRTAAGYRRGYGSVRLGTFPAILSFISNPTNEDTDGIAIFPFPQYVSVDPRRSRPVVLRLLGSGSRKLCSGRSQDIRRLRRKCHRRSRLPNGRGPHGRRTARGAAEGKRHHPRQGARDLGPKQDRDPRQQHHSRRAGQHAPRRPDQR
jgi:hypothetical protein